MRSWPAGGLGLVLRDERWQLKLKPNDAGPVNTTPSGGNCPPPRPVHAVSATARMPIAATDRERRRYGCRPVFIAVLRSHQARRAGLRIRGGLAVPSAGGGQTG